MTHPWDPFDPAHLGHLDPAVDAAIRVQWDYRREVVVGNDMCTLFDTTWSYFLYPWRTALRWQLVRSPGDSLYLQEAEVPEMVRLAVMVTE